MNAPRPLVTLPALHGFQAAAWRALVELAPRLGTDWALIGGQMVMLHQAERARVAGPAMRMTNDLDVVVNVRTRMSELARVHAVLTDHSFVQVPQQIEHRYTRASDKVQIDVLAPDHLGDHLPRLGHGNTVQAPGGTQALKRTEWVDVAFAGLTTAIPRPSLVGALIIKQATVHGAPARRRSRGDTDDICLLAALLNDDDCEAANLTAGERRLLQAAKTDVTSMPHGANEAGIAAVRLQQLIDAK